jgi:hypothetical protein
LNNRLTLIWAHVGLEFNDFDYGQIRVKNTNYRFVKK